MKIYRTIIFLFAAASLPWGALSAADVTGKWTAEFDSPIGRMNYTYDLKSEGDRVAGLAVRQLDGRTDEIELIEGKLNGDTVSFVEVRKLQDRDLRIEYTGKLVGDRIQFTRKVGDFATMKVVAQRVREAPPTRRSRRTPPVISPDIGAGGKVTFRLRAPNAAAVTVNGQWPEGRVSMSKDDAGLWSVTVADIGPGVWEYGFQVDGLRMIDPGNRAIKPMRNPRTSIPHLPGEPPLVHDFQAVPHGVVHQHDYHSNSLRRLRALTVYTPPGYDKRSDTLYPTLYLQHGSGDTEATWTVHGKAHWIIDNLIAEGRAKPMVVVMMDGHADPNRRNNTALFERDLIEDVLPLVEANYRVHRDVAQRGIVGLSMGGRSPLEPLRRGPGRRDRGAPPERGGVGSLPASRSDAGGASGGRPLIPLLARGLLAVLAASFAGMLVASLHWKMQHDSPIMIYIAYLIDRLGRVPYVDIFDMNLPGTYAVHVLLGRVFGYGDLGFRLADLTWLLAIQGITFASLRSFSRRVALGTALLFGLAYLGFGPRRSLQREFLLLLPLAGALWAAARPAPFALRGRAILVGLFCGAASTIKPHAALGLPVFLWFAYRAEGERADSRGQALLGAAAGFLMPVCAVLAYLWAAGALAPFWDAATGYWPLYAEIGQNLSIVSGPERLPYCI